MNWTTEQLDAINKSGSNIIVSAGAGSGKTAVLTERVIEKLRNGIHINELLILTFTNNAAKEMKDRIKDKIKIIPELKEELKYIDSASICTFDSFVLSLVKKYYYVLNLEKNINIIDSSIINIKKNEYINCIFDDKYRENNHDFNEFITTFGIKNDKEIKRLILNIDSKLDLLSNKEEYLESYLNKYYHKNNIDSLFNKYYELIKKRVATIKFCLYNLVFEVDGNVLVKINQSLEPILNSLSYEELKNVIDVSLPRLPNGSSDEAKYYKNNITKTLNDLKELVSDSKDNLINEIYFTNTNASIIIDILINLNERVKAYKLEKNYFEFNDISKLAIKLLNENEKVRLEIKNQYHEIMIDEYQDTNDIQELFISLIENNNVYMVGDIKQSIYGFRNANPSIFKNKYELYKSNVGGLKIDLNQNFRSRKETINSINTIFSLIMDDDFGSAKYKDEHQMIHGNMDYDKYGNNNYNNNLLIVNYESDKSYSNDEIEAFIIGKDILNKINNKYQVYRDKELGDCTYQDFTILIDRTTSFDVYKKVFDYLEIPLKIFVDEDILNNDETYLIKNIISLIMMIYNNKQDNEIKFYFSSIARSYLYQMTDEEIFKVINNNEIKNSDIYLKCLSIAKNLDYLSNYELIERIINSFDFYQKMISVGDVNSRTIIIDNLLNKAEELNKIGIIPTELEAYFNSLIENKQDLKVPALINDSDSVILTNIHKSKGLQYNICYFSGITKRFYLKEPNEKFIFSKDLGLILPNYLEGIKNTFVYDLYKDAFIAETISEKVRLFYVSLTRCKEKMIMLTNIDKNKQVYKNINEQVDYLTKMNYRSFQDFIISIYDNLTEYIYEVKTPDISQDYLTRNTIKKNVPINKEKIEVSEFEFETKYITKEVYSKSESKIFTKDEISNINLGNKIHYLFENVDLKNPDYSKMDDFEKDLIESLLILPVFKNLKHGKIFKEYDFIVEEEDKVKRGSIDLMIVYDDYVDIIDYKLKHTTDEAYIAQLHGYKSFIENKTKKQTNIYLYSVLNKELVKLD